MRKVIKRFVAAFFAVLMLVSLFPFSVFAVDPVSAATMANAMAQALTAYGAEHGVSMMFDVTNTDGIGEGVHELWDQFKADVNDNNVPTYDSLAVTLWADLYTKVSNKVAINVSAENVGFFDRFWNWLLSGPAEMQKVDNSYQWEINVQTGVVDPINVYADYNVGLVPVISNYNSLTSQEIYTLAKPLYHSATNIYRIFSPGANMAVVAYNPAGNPYQIMVGASVQDSYSYTTYCFLASYDNNWHYSGPNSFTYNSGWQSLGNGSYIFTGNYNSLYASSNVTFDIPMFDNRTDALNALTSYFLDPGSAIDDSISVRPYVGDTVPQNVPIPDTDDPDYAPLPYVGPLGVSWIDNNFGDGETMTDAQREAIAGALDNAIEDDGTLTLDEDQTVPDNPTGEVIGGPSAYTVPGLADVFPFCIPFDIYHFLQALSAEPTPPHFTATLAFPEAVGGSQQIDIDFDTPTFNQIAAVLRTMELLAFCIGLALLTRSMFIRG